MALVAVAVRGMIDPRVRREQWIWICIHRDDALKKSNSLPGNAATYCVGKTPLPATAFNQIPPFDTRYHGASVVCMEVWAAEAEDASFMQFVGGCSIDTSTWASDDAPERWYELQKPSTTKELESRPDVVGTYCDSAPKKADVGVFLQVKASFVGHQGSQPPPFSEALDEIIEQNGFHFVLPHKAIRQRGLLRRLSSREVSHQTRIPILEELLPTTLYGAFANDRSNFGPEQGLQKALTLLQLSCQYALHSTRQLEKCDSELQAKAASARHRIDHLRRSKVKLDEQRCNLVRERDVLDCALDGMKTMLRDLQTATPALAAPDHIN